MTRRYLRERCKNTARNNIWKPQLSSRARHETPKPLQNTVELELEHDMNHFLTKKLQ